MTFRSLADDRFYLSFDLSFLKHFESNKLDTLPENLVALDEKYTRIGYESLGVTGVTFDETIQPVLSIKRMHITETPSFYAQTLSGTRLSRTSSSASIASGKVDKHKPYYIRIITPDGKTDKTIAAARITDRQTALQSTSTYAKDLVESYGVESPPQIILMEFPRLGPSEKPQTGTYSELDATAALVQSCFQQSLELFQTSCIKAIPGEQQTADYLSELGFSYESPQERDCPPPVTATTQMILFPEVREAWEEYVRNYPICMPKSPLKKDILH